MRISNVEFQIHSYLNIFNNKTNLNKIKNITDLITYKFNGNHILEEPGLINANDASNLEWLKIFKARCVLCVCDHPTAECEVTEIETLRAICCNCGVDHLANYSMCREYSRNIKSIERKPTKNENKARTFDATASKRKQNVSYKAALRQ